MPWPSQVSSCGMPLMKVPGSVASSRRGLLRYAKLRPSGESRRDQSRVGVEPGIPADFQRRYALPSVSMNGSGSMLPSGSASHWKGVSAVSVKGPAGDDAVAMEMQRRLPPTSQEVNATQPVPNRATPGPHCALASREIPPFDQRGGTGKESLKYGSVL